MVHLKIPLSRLASILTFLALMAFPCAGQTAEKPPRAFFYQGLDYGSESQFNPLSSMINWTYDTLQISASFNDNQLQDRWNTVREDLTHPGQAVEARGGWLAFINRQVLPYKMTELDWIPNYALHLLGGGMVYRKNAEWLEAKGASFPRLTSAVLCMMAEVAQEVVEKGTTRSDDELADVFIFRPLGILLFSHDSVARYSAVRLHLAEWPFQPMYDPSALRPSGARGKFTNVGENFVLRPNYFGLKQHRPFVFFGTTILFGVSHKISTTDSLSWGLGAAIVQTQDPLRTRMSGGLFWDRNDSLLTSIIFNGTDNLAVRLNVYPGIMGPRAWWSPGLYVGIGNQGDINIGLTLRILPVGLAKISSSRNN